MVMRVLIACECSGIVRDAFARRGHDAWSCDLKPSETPGQHIQGDALKVIRDFGHWDLLIAHPECTHIAVSGALHFAAKCADGRQQAAVDFFMAIANCRIPLYAIENPVGIISTLWRKPDQIIQPFQYGHPESKKTCLWLRGLPRLSYTNVLPLPECGYWNNQTPSGQSNLGPSADRATIRSRTYPGISDAMASQWG